MDLDAPRSRGARPVPDAPVQALAARAGGLAKGWLIALLERRPLDAAGELPIAALARGGPPVCDEAARALASDEALRALLGRAPAIVDLTGGGEPRAVVEAAEALRAVLWAAILEALPEPRPGQLADLADRLSHVTTAFLSAALTAGERGEAAPPGPAGAPPASKATSSGARAASSPSAAADSLWREALEGRLREGERLGERTALLLVEMDGLERLLAAGDAQEALARAAAAVRAEVRRGDLVAHEAEGRAWVLAAGAGRASAEALGRRIADGVAAVPAPHGVPLTVSVGLAVHPDDGRDAGSLSAFAEEAMLAARAAGVRLVR